MIIMITIIIIIIKIIIIIIICNFQAFPSKRSKKNYVTWRFCEHQFMNRQSIENKD